MTNIFVDTSVLKQSADSSQDMDFRYCLKKIPSDFLVEEISGFYAAAQEQPVWHFQLRKEGMTTTEAVTNVARILNVPEKDIGYAGLKDQDGITNQRISIQILSHVDVTAVNSCFDATSGKWLSLHELGGFTEKITIGRLVGNSFRVVIRNLHHKVADGLAKKGLFNNAFINYYDTQRFGVPGGPSTTHLIGQAVLNEDWQTALSLVGASCSPEGAAAKAWQGDPADFFQQLDPRRLSFYYASYGSYQWNKRVEEAFLRYGEGIRVTRSSIHYTLPCFYSDVLTLASVTPTTSLTRFEVIDGERIEKCSQRQTVIHTAVKVMESGDDPLFPGRSSLTVEFLLPSGCYATMAVCQLIHLANAHIN